MLVQSIISNGLAVGAVYALIGITYNVMFSASRVFSFTAGSVGMLGGVFGHLDRVLIGTVGELLVLDGASLNHQAGSPVVLPGAASAFVLR